MTTLPPLPHAPIGRIMGLLEAMNRTPGPDSVSHLAQDLRLALDDLIPVIQAAQLLGWALVKQGQYDLTEEGRRVADSDEQVRKALFRARVTQAPLLRLILGALEGARGQPVSRKAILAQIAGRFSSVEAIRQFETAVNWGRYAELFDYDAESDCLTEA